MFRVCRCVHVSGGLDAWFKGGLVANISTGEKTFGFWLSSLNPAQWRVLTLAVVENSRSALAVVENARVALAVMEDARVALAVMEVAPAVMEVAVAVMEVALAVMENARGALALLKSFRRRLRNVAKKMSCFGDIVYAVGSRSIK